MAKRKIGFYYIYLKNGELEIPSWAPLLSVINHVMTMPRSDRKRDLDGNKFAFLDTFSRPEENVLNILFKNAKHSYRAPLLNRNTVEERENPKTMDEGEQMKTHIVLKFVEDSIIALIECGNSLMTANNIVAYLDFGLRSLNESLEDEQKIQGHFAFDMMPRDDFREMLNNMSRVSCASIFYDKSLLGSEAFEFANTTESMQDDIVIQLKAKRKKSILDTLYHFVDMHNNGRGSVKRIRVVGRTNNNNETIIDTGFIIKKEFVEVNQDSDTGEFNSMEMFAAIKDLSNQFG